MANKRIAKKGSRDLPIVSATFGVGGLTSVETARRWMVLPINQPIHRKNNSRPVIGFVSSRGDVPSTPAALGELRSPRPDLGWIRRNSDESRLKTTRMSRKWFGSHGVLERVVPGPSPALLTYVPQKVR
jgi:hypothetical protein